MERSVDEGGTYTGIQRVNVVGASLSPRTALAAMLKNRASGRNLAIVEDLSS